MTPGTQVIIDTHDGQSLRQSVGRPATVVKLAGAFVILDVAGLGIRVCPRDLVYRDVDVDDVGPPNPSSLTRYMRLTRDMQEAGDVL